MDGDDVCMPERFKTQIDFLDSHKDYAFVSTSMICFDSEGDFMTLSLREGSPTKKNFVKSTPFYHATVLVRAEAYKNVGGYSVDDKLLRVEDYHLWFKMYAAGYRGYNLSTPYYKMRDDRNAIARRTWKNRRNEAYVKIVGHKMLHLPIYYYPYALIPILKALLPTKLYTYLHRRR
jgi:glycosyltransferase EpsE